MRRRAAQLPKSRLPGCRPRMNTPTRLPGRIKDGQQDFGADKQIQYQEL